MKRQGLRRMLTTGVIAGGLLASSTAVFANDMFLKMDGIQGESVDIKHKGEIDVLSWSWGESTGTARTGQGRQPAACIQDLQLTKRIDSSSPALIMNGMLGEIVPTAVLVVRRPGDDPFEYLRLTMKNVTVTSFQTGAAQGGGLPTENVTLNFESIHGEYQKQGEDGKPSSDPPLTWDITGKSKGCK